MSRIVTAIVPALLLAACATTGSSGDPSFATPLDQHQMQVVQAPQRIALRPHEQGLSANQRSALGALYARWRDSGAGSPIRVEAPSGQGEAATRAAWSAKSFLESAGAPSNMVILASYGAAENGAPVLVGFDGVQAVVPTCGQSWGNLAANANNRASSNFGCSVTANMAAQIADPTDIVRPRNMDAADATRRGTVLGNYRQGLPTGAAASPEASGEVSSVVD